MSSLVLIGASAEAHGHPTSCTEPAPGTVESSSSISVTLNGNEIAAKSTADISFDSHAHSYSDIDDDGNDECHDNQSHSLDPDSAKLSDSLSYNGSPLYLKDTAVTSDPTTGGDVDITSDGGNSSLTENP